MDHPEQASAPGQVLIPALNRPAYSTVTSLGQERQLAGLDAEAPVGTFVYLPATPQAHLDELAVSLAVELQARTSDTVQIALMVWSAGEIKGYQIAGKTTSGSLKSALAVDAQNTLHLAWITTAGFGAYDVYYASTDPQARATLNRIMFSDITAFLLRLGWALLGSMSFFPVAFMWITVPLALASVFLFIRAEGDLVRRPSQIMLAVAVLVYLLLKYLTEPSWLVLVQLPGIALWLSNLLGAIAPLLVAGLAALVTWRLIHRLEYKSLFRTFVLFAAWDTLFTLLLYMPILLVE
jgi:hypothetical protein